MCDKTKYFIACAVISALVSCAEAILGATFGQAMIAGLIAGIAIGVGKEYGDCCGVGGRWDWGDIVADGAGALVGSFSGALFNII